MKNGILSLSMTIVLLTACAPSAENRNDKNTSPAEITPEKSRVEKPILSSDFLTLVPLDILNSKSTNVFEKYGIEFSGNCYSCDLAKLSITTQVMKWTNVCDENDVFEINNFTFTVEGDKTILKTKDRSYTLNKIDKSPIYELVIDGGKLELANKRISKYFTTNEAIPLFKENDCGEFEG